MTPEQKAWQAATPGGILLREFLAPLGLTQADLARRTGIPPSRITEIVKGRRAITAETALAFGIVFNMEAQFWINLQTTYDLRKIRGEKEAEMRKSIEPFQTAGVAEDRGDYSK